MKRWCFYTAFNRCDLVSLLVSLVTFFTYLVENVRRRASGARPFNISSRRCFVIIDYAFSYVSIWEGK